MASEPNAVSVQAVSVPVPQPDPQGARRRALYKAVARYGRDDPRVRQILGPRFEREGRRQRRGRDGVEGEDVGQRPGVEVVLELAADIARGNRGTSAARTPPGAGRGEDVSRRLRGPPAVERKGGDIRGHLARKSTRLNSSH